LTYSFSPQIISVFLSGHFSGFQSPTVCVTGAGAGVDSAWEQKKLDAKRDGESSPHGLLICQKFSVENFKRSISYR
jgi:hypothetical protein